MTKSNGFVYDQPLRDWPGPNLSRCHFVPAMPIRYADAGSSWVAGSYWTVGNAFHGMIRAWLLRRQIESILIATQRLQFFLKSSRPCVPAGMSRRSTHRASTPSAAAHADWSRMLGSVLASYSAPRRRATTATASSSPAAAPNRTIWRCEVYSRFRRVVDLPQSTRAAITAAS